ncbi:MAG: hypothetical protein WBH86_09805 [Thermogutta sp.]
MKPKTSNYNGSEVSNIGQPLGHDQSDWAAWQKLNALNEATEGKWDNRDQWIGWVA